VSPQITNTLIKGQELPAPPPTPLEVSSVEDAVYRALRREIGQLDLTPGARLRLEELAGRFQVSLTPVRHALRRLESEGLVVSLPRRGSSVAPLSVEELEEIQALRLGLETSLARRGAERCTDEALAEMSAARDEMERAFRAGDLDAYIRPFWSLRDACYRCAERPRLLRTLEDQRIRVERYILYLCRDPEAFADLRRGPDTLLEACRVRDGEAAEAATRDALAWVLAELQRMLDNAEAAPAEAS
jgi:DNA-binding GntR family transcriptional regulator